MSFIQETEKARAAEIGGQAFDRIRKEGLSPYPEIFELWYVYYARSKQEVVRAIDLILEKRKNITDAECQELHEKLLSDTRNEETVRRAGEQIQAAIEGVASQVKTVGTAASDYSQSLDNVVTRITAAKSRQDIESAIHAATVQTKTMLEQNRKLEAELAHSTVLMADLRRDLEYVRREAMTDGLTGLSNRKCFDEEIALLRDKTLATGATFTLLMVDIDHFKSFNDNFGHQVGDQVLRLVARTLKDGLKGRDFASRYGGEEFAILLPETPAQSGIAVGNSLRQAIAMKDVINRSSGDVLGRITMSIGVAEYTSGEEIEDLIERADAALYAAKRGGRNRVEAAPVPGGNPA